MAERDNRDELESLADSALDGGPVDWVDAESHASDADRGVVQQLRLVSAIAKVHRTVGSETFPQKELPPPLALPTRWGPLEVREHVGRGSFGNVYRAWDLRLDREVALKLLLHDSEDLSSSIISEGRLLARIRHPNVVTIHGADRIDGRVGLWMEFVRGRTLEQLLADRGAFGAQEALLVGLDLCRALSAVHGAGVVHRDVKAQNVIREEGGRVVLMDFGTGLERPFDAGDPALSGTPLYLAPELFHSQPATRQSDIYSLGVLLFHLVSRSYPVPGRSISEVRAAHRRRPARMASRSQARSSRAIHPDDRASARRRSRRAVPKRRRNGAGAARRLARARPSVTLALRFPHRQQRHWPERSANHGGRRARSGWPWPRLRWRSQSAP